MMPPLTPTEQRAILFSARIRFAPETQPIRETAIDKIIEQNLLFSTRTNSLSIPQIQSQGLLSFGDGLPIINDYDVQKSLTRLFDAGRVNTVLPKAVPLKRQSFCLTKSVRDELARVQLSADALIDRVISKLYRPLTDDFAAYKFPFLELLCLVFSNLGEKYVRLIKGDIGIDQFFISAIIIGYVDTIILKNAQLDADILRAAVRRFFHDADPDFDTLKWNLAQNYYIAKCLGLDPQGELLSAEVFGNAEFYLDTNVIIQAMEQTAPGYSRFAILNKACKKLNIKLKVSQITIDELKSVVAYHGNLAKRVSQHIPDEMAEEINNIFYRIYREKVKTDPEATVDTVLSGFAKPMDTLAENFDVELIDDRWFTEAPGSDEITRLIKSVKEEYFKKRQRPKKANSALHDALLLSWVAQERERENPDTWLVTRDTSLPAFESDDKSSSGRALAVTLDAILQWISPAAVTEEMEGDFAAIFADAIKYQLLPQETFFDLRDFLMFSELDWETKELPAEDVRGCIRYIKKQAAKLDPLNAVDRERLAREMKRYFADPGRKYKEEIHRLEEEREQYAASMTEEIQKLKERNEALMLDKITIEQDLGNLELRRQSQVKGMFILSGLILCEFLAAVLAVSFGDGDNIFQRIIKSWVLLTSLIGVFAVLSWLVIGREGIRSLGWPFSQILKNE